MRLGRQVDGSLPLESAGLLEVSRGASECVWLPRAGGRGLGVVGELGIYGRGGFKFH